MAQAMLATASKTQLNVQLGFLLHRTVISSPRNDGQVLPPSVLIPREQPLLTLLVSFLFNSSMSPCQTNRTQPQPVVTLGKAMK